MKNSEMPIHPLKGADGTIFKNDGYLDQCKDAPLIGLTKREYLAGLAMRGLCGQIKEYTAPDDGKILTDKLSIEAVRMADALLKQLNG